MRTLLFIALALGTTSTAFSQTQLQESIKLAPAQSTPSYPKYIQPQQAYNQATALVSKLKPVTIYSFDAIEEARRNQLIEDCRILDRLINKDLPKLSQNALGVNVNHSASSKLSYVAGKGFILAYDLPFHLGVAPVVQNEKPKKEVTEWEKARIELTHQSWRPITSTQSSDHFVYGRAVTAYFSASPVKVKELTNALIKTLTNAKNVRGVNGETVTVFVYGKVNSSNRQRNVLAFEVEIASNLTEKDVRTRTYPEKVHATNTSSTLMAR